jgi:hypothetical protein
MYDYLAATKRKEIGDFAREYAAELHEDEGAEFDQFIELNLSELEPHINGPFTPDLATPISKFKEAVKENKWPEELKVGLIGSCTNSSYEDMTRAASIAEDAMAHGIGAKALFTVTPGSEQIRATIARDGQLETFEKFGGMVLANACGPCIGKSPFFVFLSSTFSFLTVGGGGFEWMWLLWTHLAAHRLEPFNDAAASGCIYFGLAAKAATQCPLSPRIYYCTVYCLACGKNDNLA